MDPTLGHRGTILEVIAAQQFYDGVSPTTTGAPHTATAHEPTVGLDSPFLGGQGHHCGWGSPKSKPVSWKKKRIFKPQIPQTCKMECALGVHCLLPKDHSDPTFTAPNPRAPQTFQESWSLISRNGLLPEQHSPCKRHV